MTAALPPGPLGGAVADVATAGALPLGSAASGVVLGLAGGLPVAVPLVRPEPGRALVVGPLGLAQVVALRAFAAGCRVEVRTARPAAWDGVLRLAAGGTTGAGLAADADPGAPGSPAAPRLVVLDEETGTAAEPPAVGGWTTVLTVADRLTRWSGEGLGSLDLVVAAGLSRAEARLVAAAVALPAAERVLPGLPPGSVGVAGHGAVRTLSLAQTSVERWLVGPLD